MPARAPQAFRRFVTKQPRAPEYLSQFVDSKLRKGAKEVLP